MSFRRGLIHADVQDECLSSSICGSEGPNGKCRRKGSHG